MDHSTFDVIVSWILVCIGAACVVSLLMALIVWAIKTIIRNIMETKYTFSVKYYIQDTHNRLVDYDLRIRNIENKAYEMQKQIKEVRINMNALTADGAR